MTVQLSLIDAFVASRLENHRFTALKILNYVCMCVKNSSSIQLELDQSIAANSDILFGFYLEAMASALQIATCIQVQDLNVILRFAKACSLKNRSSLVHSVICKCEPIQSGFLEWWNDGDCADLNQECPICSSHIPFVDVFSGTCANGHSWSIASCNYRAMHCNAGLHLHSASC